MVVALDILVSLFSIVLKTAQPPMILYKLLFETEMTDGLDNYLFPRCLYTITRYSVTFYFFFSLFLKKENER